jgi:hypothetical protein
MPLIVCFSQNTTNSTLHGKVYYFNSNNSPVYNAYIKSERANTKSTDVTGHFRLKFDGVFAGELVNISISYGAFGVVNQDERNRRLPKSAGDTAYFLLSPPESLIDDREKYYIGKSLSNYRQKTEKRISKLERSGAKYADSISSLRKSIIEFRQRATEMALIFAKSDYDSLSLLNQMALRHFMNGNFDSVQQLLNDSLIESRVNAGYELSLTAESLKKISHSLVRESATSYYIKGTSFLSQGYLSAAKYYFERSIRTDTSNIQYVINYAATLTDLNEYGRSIDIAKRGLKMQPDPADRGQIYTLLAYDYYRNVEIDSSFVYCKNALSIYESRGLLDSNNILNTSRAYKNLSFIYLVFYEFLPNDSLSRYRIRYLDILKHLKTIDSAKNSVFIAQGYNMLGLLYKYTRPDSAIYYLDSSIQLIKYVIDHPSQFSSPKLYEDVEETLSYFDLWNVKTINVRNYLTKAQLLTDLKSPDAIFYFKAGKSLLDSIVSNVSVNSYLYYEFYYYLGDYYKFVKLDNDSAEFWYNQCIYETDKMDSKNKFLSVLALQRIGEIAYGRGDFSYAKTLLNLSMKSYYSYKLPNENSQLNRLSRLYYLLGRINVKERKFDSSRIDLYKAIDYLTKSNDTGYSVAALLADVNVEMLLAFTNDTIKVPIDTFNHYIDDNYEISKKYNNLAVGYTSSVYILAQYHLFSGEPRSAIISFMRVMESYQSLSVKEKNNKMPETCLFIAESYSDLRRYRKAAYYLLQALTTFDYIKGEVMSKEFIDFLVEASAILKTIPRGKDKLNSKNELMELLGYFKKKFDVSGHEFQDAYDLIVYWDASIN